MKDRGLISGRTSRILPCTHIRPFLMQGLQESEPEDFPKLFIDPNEVYCSEASPGSDSEISEDPGHPDSPPAAKAPSSPTLYEVVYEAGALERMQGEAGPAVGLISIQLGQYCSVGRGPRPFRSCLSPAVTRVSPACATPQALLPAGCTRQLFSQPPVSSDQWSPPLMVPDACMVSELPLDVHAHIIPRAGTVHPVPPSTLVSLGVGWIQSSLIHTYIPTQWGSGREN